jgi:hypothetical protein
VTTDQLKLAVILAGMRIGRIKIHPKGFYLTLDGHPVGAVFHIHGDIPAGGTVKKPWTSVVRGQTLLKRNHTTEKAAMAAVERRAFRRALNIS